MAPLHHVLEAINYAICPDCMLAKSANHCINTMDGTLCIMCRLHDLLIRYTKKSTEYDMYTSTNT
jgi:hypothetical protein